MYSGNEQKPRKQTKTTYTNQRFVKQWQNQPLAESRMGTAVIQAFTLLLISDFLG